MGKLNIHNLRKTISYLKCNGLRETLVTIREHLPLGSRENYRYIPPAESTLEEQRDRSWEKPVTFSVVVPAYHTPERYYREMIESVLGQTIRTVFGEAAPPTSSTKSMTGRPGTDLSLLAACDRRRGRG